MTEQNKSYKQHLSVAKAFHIFQVHQYFTIYRQYFVSKFEHFHVYLIQYSLKSRSTNYHFKLVKVPGASPIERPVWHI